MRGPSMLLLPLLLVFAVPVVAQTQATMNSAAGSDFAAADARLNSVYKQVMARLSPGGQSRLKAAQRAWIASRDASCSFVSSGPDGGSVAPMIAAGCKTEQTEERTTWLAGFVTCAEGDLSCPR